MQKKRADWRNYMKSHQSLKSQVSAPNYTANTSNSCWYFTKNKKFQLAVGDKGKIRGLLKSLEFILLET